MKKILFTIAILTTLMGTIFISCKSSVEKIEDAKENVQKANDKVADANIKLNREINDSIMKFKQETERKIIAQNKSIADFKLRIAKEKMTNKARYERKLAEIEQKNTDLKKRLDEYKEEGQEKWYAFKVKFSNDMNDLGKAINGFFD